MNSGCLSKATLTGSLLPLSQPQFPSLENGSRLLFKGSPYAPCYLHDTVVPEVKSDRFHFADVWKVAVDSGAVQTDKDAQLVRGPVGICGVRRQGGELGEELAEETTARLGAQGEARAWQVPTAHAFSLRLPALRELT